MKLSHAVVFIPNLLCMDFIPLMYWRMVDAVKFLLAQCAANATA